MNSISWLPSADNKTLKPLLTEFENGKTPKELTDKQRQLLNDLFAKPTLKTFAYSKDADCVPDKVNSLISKLQTTIKKKVNRHLETNNWHRIWLSFSHREVNMQGYIALKDAKLIKCLHDAWNALNTPQNELEQLRAEVATLKAKTKKTTKKGKSK